MLDADEVCGCVVVGISNLRTREAAENYIKLSGIPPEAVQIKLMDPIIPFQDVQGTFRPLVGGIQIKNDSGIPLLFGVGSGICTLSVVADRLGVTGFITASHCTRIQGGVEGTSFYQNGRAIFAGDYVAHESADPAWTAGPGCPTGSFCRASDSAFAVIDIGNQNGAMTVIARPTTLCTTATCSIAMPSSSSSLTLTGMVSPALAGTVVTKVGRTTGWTSGTITSTCATTAQAGTSFVALCTSFASAGGQGGDSGSPVFTVPAGAGSSATTGSLVGVLWGGNTAGTSIAFSPIGAVLSELGSISLFPPPPPPPGPPTPPSACVSDCKADRDSCMASVAQPDGPRPAECVSAFKGCLTQCAKK